MLIQKLGNGPEDAIATHALYSTSVAAPPQGSPDNDHTTFDDGSTLTVAPVPYASGDECLNLDVNGATFNANDDLYSVGGQFTVTACLFKTVITDPRNAPAPVRRTAVPMAVLTRAAGKRSRI
jgi:hypothetical protein